MRTKRNMAAQSARVWNQKNLTPRAREFQERGLGEVLEQTPAAALGWLRRRPGIVVASLVAVGVVTLAWVLSQRD